ncbi:MAG: host attachment protein [Limnohabitans sp.]
MLEFPLWVVVANASRARIFLRERASSPLLLREERQHAAGRRHPLALERTPHGQTIGGRSGLALRTPQRERERHVFAHELASALRSHCLAHDVGDLVVYASNPFLGDLVHGLDNGLLRRLKVRQALDLTRWTVSRIEERLALDLGI